MVGTGQSSGLVSVLEADFRQLAHDARKSEGFASFFSNADNQPEVKEAAERAVMRLRGLADHSGALQQIRTNKARFIYSHKVDPRSLDAQQIQFLISVTTTQVHPEMHTLLNLFSGFKWLQDIFTPLQLACDTKSPRLVCQSLSTIQKLLSNEALSQDNVEAAISMLAKVERLNDEGVQLKMLQTALTMFQSPLHPTSEDAISTILGLCFRALTQKGRKETVTSTAAATVRQAVTLVFTYVDVPAELARMRRVQEAHDKKATELERSPSPEGLPAVVAIAGDDVDAPASTLIAAQRLLEDLIAIATGAPPSWMKTTSLPRTFVLEILDFALANNTVVFRSLPAFESALSLRISQLLQAQLQDYLDAGMAGASLAAASYPAFKATLRCVRTVLVRYHAQLGGRCGTLIQTVLRGLAAGHPPAQRVAVAHLIRQLLCDAPLVYYLFSKFDMQKERKLDAVHAIVRAAADVVDAALKPPSHGDTGASSTGYQAAGGALSARTSVGSGKFIYDENDPMVGISAAFHVRASGVEDWNFDCFEYDGVPVAAQNASLAYLATDALLLFTSTVERLTDGATEGRGELRGTLSPRDTMAESPSDPENRDAMAPSSRTASIPANVGCACTVEREVCCELIERTWRALLAVLSQLLARASPSEESLVLALLKSYQGFTQACGVLLLEEPRDAFLGALCHLALAGEGDYEQGGSPRMSHNRSAGGGNAPNAGSIKGIGSDDGAGSPTSTVRTRFHSKSRSLSPRRSIPSPDGEADEGLVLSLKNIQAMRTLFNIAHRLANVLGPGWSVVLETLNTLDRVLNSPRTTTTQEAGPMATGGQQGQAVSSDLVILSSSASQLFECTRTMDREAVVALLSGLRDVSLNNMPANSASSVSQPKMFALGRMVEVLLFNVHRIYDLWGIFLAHILEIVSDPQPLVRSAAIDALGGAVVGALGELPTAFEVDDDSSLPSPQAAASTGGLEHMLLVALEALYNDDRERDVRVGVLRVLLAVLQRHGERLTDGWTPVFRLLMVVPGQDDPETINLGFQSLQITSTDYMPSMPFPRLKRCLEVATAYGKQQCDVNVSLTTISLLWNVGDMLTRSVGSNAKGHGALGHKKVVDDDTGADENEEDLERQPGQNSVLVAVSTQAQAEELLDLVFSALQALSQDPRPEVRNSGARTLFAHVVTQGPRLSRALWERCLWELLFPLLRHAFTMSVTSSREEAEAALLGRSKGAQVRLVVHHSRNTEQKQWDETVVVAVNGMSRLLRAHLPAIAVMEAVEAGWEELMVVTESSLAGGRKEVALAATALLGGVLGTHGADETVVSERMWRRAFRALDVGVEAATSAGCQVPLAARVELVHLVGSLYGSQTLRAARFSETDTQSVFRWTEAFCRNPWSEDDVVNPVQTIGMPPVQKAALALLPTLAPQHAPHLWPAFVVTVVRLLQPAHVETSWREQQEQQLLDGATGEAGMDAMSTVSQKPAAVGAVAGPLGTGANGTIALPAKQAQHRYALNSAFLEKILDVMVDVYDQASMEVRAVTLAAIAEALGRCMELRFTAYLDDVWRSAAKAFNQIIPMGMASLEQDPTVSREAVGTALQALALALENFLLGVKFQRERMGVDASKKAAVQPRQRHHSHPADDGSLTGGEYGGKKGSENAAVGPQTLPVVPVLDIPSHKRGGSMAAAKTSHVARPAPPVASLTQPIDPAQGRSDAELELSVLDTLTDGILSTTPSIGTLGVKRRLISVVDRGIIRPRALSIPQATTGSNFSHVCVRKMYVLCSRATGAAGGSSHTVDRRSTDDHERRRSSDGTLEVARLALPLFLFRADSMLRAFAEESKPGPLGDGPPIDRPRLDEIMCILEVAASMTLAPEVADAALPPLDEPVGAVVSALRARPEVAARGRERTHLLLLYSALCECIVCKEPRVREMVRDVLGLAGAELGLGAALVVPPAMDA